MAFQERGQGGVEPGAIQKSVVDRLIEQAVKTIPQEKRVKLYRRIHEILYEDQPYTFMLESAHTLLAYHSKFKNVKPWYAYDIGLDYWWIDSRIQ